MENYISRYEALRDHGNITETWFPVTIKYTGITPVLGDIIASMEDNGIGLFTVDATPDSTILYFAEQTDQMTILLKYGSNL